MDGQARYMTHEQLVLEYANKECSLYAPKKRDEDKKNLWTDEEKKDLYAYL